MSVRVNAFIVLIALLSVAIIPSQLTKAQVTLEQCQKVGPNYRPATATDAAVRNGEIPEGTCYDPNTIGISQTSEEAKAYINSLPKQPLSNCAPPNIENIRKLNAGFAVCAAQFFKAYTAQYGQNSIRIRSAYRDGASGANACAGGAAGSNHTRGYAIDVGSWPETDSNYQQMWRFASQNPQFGVCFPFQDGRTSGFRDRPHIILAGIGGNEAALCARQGVTRACSGAPVGSTTPPPYTPPTNTFANQLRQALGMQQQPQMMPQMQQPQAALPQQQSPLGAFNQAPLPHPTQPAQPVSGSIGTAPLPTPGKSVADQLRDIINGTTTTTHSTSTATSAPIVITPESAGTVVSVTYSSSSQQYGSGSLQPVGQNTFSSTDTSQSSSTPANTQRIIQLYTTLRDVLIRILNILRPFSSERLPDRIIDLEEH